MDRIVVDSISPAPTAIARAGAAIRGGELVAFPTETVYGLGAHAFDPQAIQRLYRAKGRPPTNPLILHVPDIAAARSLVAIWPPAADRLARHFWPGPLTLVLPRLPHVPDEITAGLPTVAVRIPGHPVALAILRSAGVPVAAPSANLSSRLSPTTADHVALAMEGRIDLLIDGGATPRGIESTVVDLSGDRPVLLRPGAISARELEPVAGILLRPSGAPGEDEPAPSPGMGSVHYAPSAPLFIVEPDARSREEAVRRARRIRGKGGKVGGVLLRPFPEVPMQHALLLPDDPHGYERLLYGALHSLDALGCRLILVEAPPAGGDWEAVRDRLGRAALDPSSESEEG